MTAPRALSFDSDVRTQEVRSQAAAAVPDVLVLEPGIRDSQTADLDRRIAAIERARDDATLAASARESAIRSIPGVTLSPRAAQTIASASRADWATMASEARSV